MCISLAILLPILTSAGFVPLCVYFVKRWVQHEFDAKLEVQKSQLTQDSAIKIEKLRSELQITSIRYSRVFEKTAETITEAYAKLLALNDAIAAYVIQPIKPPEAPTSTLRDEVAKAGREFLEFYRPRKIFLPESTARRFDEFELKVRSTFGQMEIMVVPRGSITNADQKKQSDDVWMEAIKFTQQEAPLLLALLEKGI